jgi:proteasome lid subunit RPN8/RPN11
MNANDLKPLMPAMAAECDARYPAEACGLLIADAKGALSFVAIPNIAGSASAALTSSRTRRDGYVMDPQRLFSELEKADEAGRVLAGIVHSHPDVGAYFSREDRDMALGGGDSPLWPGVDYLVISCRTGHTDDARLFHWEDARKEFAEEPIPVA